MGRRETLHVNRATDALYTLATSTGVASRVNTDMRRFGAYIYNPSGLTWVGPPPSKVENDNELPSLYMGDNRGYLWKVNKDTGFAKFEGQLGTGDVTGLAWFDETSTLYFVDDTSDTLNTVTNFPEFLPNAGDLYYNGSNFADGFVRWDNPWWVQQGSQCRNDPKKCSTYEHDLKLVWNNSGGWFSERRLTGINRIPANPNNSTFCTAWSDLPVGYDDYPSAGAASSSSSREDDLIELSFGTFKAPLIERGRDYYGFWMFNNQRGAGSTTSVKLYGQEGRFVSGILERNPHCRSRVGSRNPWCVIGRQEGSLLESGATWSYGTSSYTTYSRP